MTKDQPWSEPHPPATDYDAVLAEHLGQLQTLTRHTLDRVYNGYDLGRILECTKIAGGLIGTSARVARLLKSNADSKTVHGVRRRKDP